MMYSKNLRFIAKNSKLYILNQRAMSVQIPFSREKRGEFQQAAPQISNQYTCHPILSRYIKNSMPPEVKLKIYSLMNS